MIRVLAVISIQGLFPRGLEGPIEDFSHLGITFHFRRFLFLVGFEKLGIGESYKKLNTVHLIIGNYFGLDLGGILEPLLAGRSFDGRVPLFSLRSKSAMIRGCILFRRIFGEIYVPVNCEISKIVLCGKNSENEQ